MNAIQRLAICNALLFALAPIVIQSALAGEEPASSTAGEPVARPDPERPVENPDSREKRRKALAGLAAVVGITIVGIALGTLVILWAGRLRRINREPLPRTCVQNEYWFLKPAKPPVSETGPDETQG